MMLILSYFDITIKKYINNSIRVIDGQNKKN
jgi:hypothetical protein